MEVKKLTIKKIKTGGRNMHGRITSFHRGGGHKSRIRLVDFKKQFDGEIGKVLTIEKDPNRTGKIGLVYYTNNIVTYNLLAQGVNVGDYIQISDGNFMDGSLNKLGSTYRLKELKIGDVVSNIELYPGSGGKIARAAGTSGIIQKGSESLNEKDSYVQIKLSSGEIRLFSSECKAMFGEISAKEHRYKKLRKAGESRWRGRRPIVRGVAMNPVDHPHGGGEGKTSGGRCSVTPWGKLTKGKKTRNVKINNKLIVCRRK